MSSTRIPYVLATTILVVPCSLSALRIRSLRAPHRKPYEISIASTWKNLDCTDQRLRTPNAAWTLVGVVELSKKARGTVKLKQLHLPWHGKKITHLLGSLYRANARGDLIPTERYLVCDGTWHANVQTLKFTCNTPLNLNTKNKFYVLLLVPDELEETLQSGYFGLEAASLPRPYRPIAYRTPWHLTLWPRLRPDAAYGYAGLRRAGTPTLRMTHTDDLIKSAFCARLRGKFEDLDIPLSECRGYEQARLLSGPRRWQKRISR